MNDALCKAHSGHESRLITLEDNVRNLLAKWDGMQKLLIGTTITVILNLVGVIVILLR